MAGLDLAGRGVSASIVGALTICGFLLRLAGIDQSFFGDELWTHHIATRPELGAVIDGVQSDMEISPPFYFVLAWAAGKAGDPAIWLRVPSLLAGTALIPLTFLLGLRTVGRAPALVGTSLVALSPYAIYYSDEARAYSVMGACVLVSTLALLRALDTGRIWWWATFSGAACLALYSHYTALFALAAQGGWALWFYRERLNALLVAHGVIAVAFLPWLPQVGQDRSAPFQQGIENFLPFSFSFFLESIVIWVDGQPLVGIAELPGAVGFLLLGLAVLAAILGAAQLARRPLGGKRILGARRTTWLLLALALVTPVGAGLYSAIAPSIYAPRTLIASLPALCVGIAACLCKLRAPVAGIAVTLVVAAFGITALRGLSSEYARPPHREAAEFIDHRAERGATVLELTSFDFGYLDLHLREPFTLFKSFCADPITKSGQLLSGEVKCTSPPQVPVAEALRRARAGTLAVVAPAEPRIYKLPGFVRSLPVSGPGAEALRDLEGFRLVASRRLPGVVPLVVSLYRSRD